MKTVEIIRSCFAPDGKRTPTILKRGTIVTLEDAKAKTLVDKGYAAEVTGKKDQAESPAETQEAPAPKKRKSKEA